jgi:hypothetical protein
MQDGNSEEYIEAEPQQDTGSEENQIEVLQQETQVPQLPASPLQLCPEFESVTEPQVSSETQLKILPHRTTRGKPKTAYEPLLTSKPHYPMSNFVSYHKLSKENETFMNQISAISIPNSVQEAITDSRWKEAMNEEMRSLQKNCTWEVVELPAGKVPVGCRWVFTIKHKANGTIERFKARLVAKGYTQTYGIDYMETFAPVAKINIVCILLSLAVNLDWPLYHLDVKNTFLHGDLQEEVYMELPPGCIMQIKGSTKVCRLKKSLYGLKQSPRAWFGRFTNFMKSIGYKQSNSDHTLFLKTKKGEVTALIVYVDDMIVTRNNPGEQKALPNCLAQEFEMKSLGHLKYFLGIEVSRSKEGIFFVSTKVCPRFVKRNRYDSL